MSSTQKQLDFEPDKKRRRICKNSDNDHNSFTNDINLPINNNVGTLLLCSNERDNNQFLSIYNSLKSLNFFDLIVPVDILRIIAYDAVGTIIPCHICKNSETLIMHENLTKFITCNSKKCDKFQRKLVCCQGKKENHHSCDECSKVYCTHCYKKHGCLHECEGYCGQNLCNNCCQFCSDIDLDSSDGHYFCDDCIGDSMGICDYCNKHFHLDRGEAGDGLTCAVCNNDFKYFDNSTTCGRSECENAQRHEYECDYGFSQCENCERECCGGCMITCQSCERTRCDACGLPSSCKECCFICGASFCEEKECGDICEDDAGTKEDDIVVGCVNCGRECCHECQYKWMLMFANLCEYCNTMYCNDCIDIESHNCAHADREYS